MNKAEYYIKRLNLQPHPEGGFFSEIFRSQEIIPEQNLPERFDIPHCFSTYIYFLLKSGQISKFHRHKSDEIWNFLDGSPLILYFVDKIGKLNKIVLGKNLEEKQVLSYVVPPECWMASMPSEDNSYSLVGCMVAPGFEFNDFEIADKKELLKEYSDYSDIINILT